MSGPYQFLPPLSDAEYDALRADIAANGMRHPILVDEKGKILDGHHRARIAGELGFKPERETVAGLTEEEKRDLAFTLNSARRHLDAAGRRAAVVASLKADPQLSDRQHARRTGVSHPTVAGIRAELVAKGDVESLSTRTDSAGRQQPATRPTNSPADPPTPVVEAPPSQDQPGPDHPIAPGEEPTPGLAPSVAADVSEAPTGPTVVAGDSSPTTPAEGTGVVGADFDAALDRLVPDPEPYGPWRLAYLGHIEKGRYPLAAGDEMVAEAADDECMDELRRLAEDVAAFYERVCRIRRERYGDNVIPIRRAQ